MRKSKKVLSTLMAIIVLITSISFATVQVSAVATPSFTIKSVTGITTTDATISARITNPAKTTITKVGFQLGTASNKLSINKYDTLSAKYNYVDASYLMSKYKVTLKAGTTYYYRFYMTTGGKTYYSGVKSFKTKANTTVVSAPAFTINSVTDITTTNAKISARITNPAKTTITRVGFQLGTSSSNLSVNKYDTVSMKYSYVDASFLMSKYGVTLKAGTKYYYRFYIITGGKTYYSSTKSLDTKKITTSTTTKTPVFTIKGVTGITATDAQISARITNPAKTTITKVGFQLGTAKNKLTVNKSDKVSMNNSYVEASYKMSKYGVTLKENTKYYYRFYIVTGGKTYYSAVNTFTTKKTTATTYKAIKSLSIRRIQQPSNDKKGSCYLSSVATLYGYKVTTYDGVNYRTAGGNLSQSKSKLYKDFYKKNGNTTYMYDSTISYYGLKKKSYSLSTLYSQLKAGKPCVVYNGNHASLVIGYKGNSSKLNEKDFVVMEIKGYSNVWKNSASYFNTYSNKPQTMSASNKSCYVTLSSWCSYTGGTPTKIVTY